MIDCLHAAHGAILADQSLRSDDRSQLSNLAAVRDGGYAATISLWEDHTAIDKLACSSTDQESVHRIEAMGMLESEQVVTVLLPYGGCQQFAEFERQLK
ncbi:MAG: hypothetical protein BMS9Abin28_2369 [Anaerolineae bacterium]|nr:MAG: hypothetical protein BMS9Abin28_2369 [Anaerolineae bacterium]